MIEAKIPELSEAGVPMNYANKPGQMMPNGAIIIAETITQEPDWTVQHSQRESVVLALTQSEVSPYATWLRVVRHTVGSVVPKAQDFCETGHYHSRIVDAVKEYGERVNHEHMR